MWEKQVNATGIHGEGPPTDPPTWFTMRKEMTEAQAIELRTLSIADGEADGIDFQIIEYGN